MTIAELEIPLKAQSTTVSTAIPCGTPLDFQDIKGTEAAVSMDQPTDTKPSLSGSAKKIENLPGNPSQTIYYLIQVEGDSEFRLTAQSARKNGVKAEFLPEGWVYQNKKDAEEVAKRWTQGKRKLRVVLWFEYTSLLNDIWNGTKSNVRLARKTISVEIEKYKNNKKIEKIESECGHLLHPSWLHAKKAPEDLSDREKNAYEYYKPLWDKTFEEEEKIDLRSADIVRENEDLKSSITNEVGQEVVVGGIPKKITDMKSLDLRFAQLEVPGQPCVTIHRSDALPISQADYVKRLSGEVVPIGVDNNGQPKYTDASKFWAGNTHKMVYKKIVFTDKPVGNDTYNLFTGFGVKPKKGDCNKILAHIKDVICAGSEQNNTAMIKLLAWQIQNIGKPSRIITALKSKAQQVGKGCLLEHVLAPIYGNAGFVTSDLGQIITRFNDTIRGKAFIFLDEALFSGDRKSADAIKSLATTTCHGIESKGIPTVQVPIAVNLFLATNHDDAAHVEESDARYWILEASPHRVGDTNYFTELYAEIEGEGKEAFMYHLLSLDVKDFVPSRDVPKDNEFKEAMIRNSINPYDARKWLEECCRAQMILGFNPRDKDSKLLWELWQNGEEYINSVFITAYTEWQKTVKSPVAARPTPSNKFGELLNKAGLVQRVDGQRFRSLPDPEECLKTVLEMIEKSGK